MGLISASEDHRIYCTLGYHMGLISELMSSSQVTVEVSYFLALYMDQHIPLMNHIVDTNKYSDEY